MARRTPKTRHSLVKKGTENLLLYLYPVGEKKRGQATEICQSHKGNGHSPIGRLGKHGIRESGKVAQHHRRNRPLPGRFYICILPRLLNTVPAPEQLRQRSGHAGRGFGRGHRNGGPNCTRCPSGRRFYFDYRFRPANSRHLIATKVFYSTQIDSPRYGPSVGQRRQNKRPHPR